jgi:hypothetical protein
MNYCIKYQLRKTFIIVGTNESPLNHDGERISILLSSTVSFLTLCLTPKLQYIAVLSLNDNNRYTLTVTDIVT